MNRANKRCLELASSTICMAFLLVACGANEARPETSPIPIPVIQVERSPIERQDPSAFDSAAVVDSINHYSRMSAKEAQRQYEALLAGRAIQSNLQLIVLELFGPESVRSADRAQQRLLSLAPYPGSLVTEDVVRLLDGLISRSREHQRLQEQLSRAEAALAEEKADHLATKEKLDALRQIEREIGSRNGSEQDSVEDNRSAVDEEDIESND